MIGNTWYQPPQHDNADGWAALYHATTWGLVGLMGAGYFMYSADGPFAEKARPEILPLLPLVLIAISVAWTMFAPQNRKLRFILLPVYVVSTGAYYLLGPWWGMGISQGGSYLVQAVRFMTEPPEASPGRY
jgi:hypothetical protein